MTVGKRIRKLRLDNNLSSKGLAYMIGVAPETLSNWEHDRHKPGPFYTSLLSAALKTTRDFILFGGELSIVDMVKNKTIENIIVEERLDGTGYYFDILFSDKSTLRVTDRVMFKKGNDKHFKEIRI